MKQNTAHVRLQKTFALVMALLVLSLTLFFPQQAKAFEKDSSATETIVSSVSYSDAPDLTVAPERFVSLTILVFALPKLWAMLLEALSSEIQEYRAVFHQFFIQKINFVFVSTLAP